MAKTHNLRVAPENGFSWVAVAFSKDKLMGKDLVFPCTNAPNGEQVTGDILCTRLIQQGQDLLLHSAICTWILGNNVSQMEFG